MLKFSMYLPHRGALAAIKGNKYGTGLFSKEDIVMGDVSCDGVEWRLQDCRHTAVHDCTLAKSAGVMCALNDGGCVPSMTVGVGPQ